MAQLTSAEVRHYEAEGYVIPQFRLPSARVALMRDALDALIRDNPGVRPEKLVSAHVEGDNGEGVRGSRAFLDLAMDPEIVELVSGVIENGSSRRPKWAAYISACLRCRCRCCPPRAHAGRAPRCGGRRRAGRRSSC